MNIPYKFQKAFRALYMEKISLEEFMKMYPFPKECHFFCEICKKEFSGENAVIGKHQLCDYCPALYIEDIL